MKDHIMDSEKAEKLEDEARYRILSQEELLAEVKKGDTVVDIGSGTGFFTDDLAEVAETVYAVDFQEGMHDFYRKKGVPENVELVHSRASDLKIDGADLVVSILSLHEIDLEKSLQKFHNILNEKGRLLIVDWSANAEADNVPPREKLYTAEKTGEKVSELFDVVESEERRDTFKLNAVKK
jgi:ubiquinone/menaquinone biosynthesis C-methylase UbiE